LPFFLGSAWLVDIEETAYPRKHISAPLEHFLLFAAAALSARSPVDRLDRGDLDAEA
jgi:hypothetical protein